MRKRNALKHGAVAVMLSSTLILASPVTASAGTFKDVGDIAKTVPTSITESMETSTGGILQHTIATLNKMFAEKKAATKAKAKKEAEAKAAAKEPSWNGPKLTPAAGAIQGPSGKETYYNLPMQGVVNIMRNAGYSEAEYPYHVREDGVKMLGPYIMVAANLNLRPRGTIYQTSLGQAIVCDTGEFAYGNPTQTDIAVSW